MNLPVYVQEAFRVSNVIFQICMGVLPEGGSLKNDSSTASICSKSTSKNIDEIIEESGFANMSHYIRAFKEKFGITPYQFRKTEATKPGAFIKPHDFGLALIFFINLPADF